MNIKGMVDSLVEKHKTRDPFEMILGLNVILIRCPLEGVRGFYQYFQRNNIIYIDENLTKSEQKIVCAHELGHMFMHKKANAVFMDTRTYLKTTGYENEANTFAMHLLLPDEELRNYRGFTLNQISCVTGYARELLELRLK